MTDDRIEGMARTGVGRLQDAAGGLLGDENTQAKGKLNQATGAVQDAYGKAKDTIENAVGYAGDHAEDAVEELSAIVRERPLVAVGVSLGLGVLVGLLAAGSRR